MMLLKKPSSALEFEPLLRVLRIYKLNMMVSAPLLQGHMLGTNLDGKILGCDNNSARHLNFLRSIPAECITSILCGMKSPKSLLENTEVIYKAPLDKDGFWDYLRNIDTSDAQRQVKEAEEKMVQFEKEEADKAKALRELK
jgi:hypothetical protein